MGKQQDVPRRSLATLNSAGLAVTTYEGTLGTILVPVRGYDKGCSAANVAFSGIAA
jgi:hypothetical protein